MPRQWALIPALAFLVACTTPALATTVVVPDNYPTIQAAIDGGADVIQVRDGLAPERLTIAHSVTIEPALSAAPLIQTLAVPHWPDCGGGIEGIRVVSVKGCRILGRVDMGDCPTGGFTFEGCRFDSGLVAPDPTYSRYYSVRGCMFLGDVTLSGYLQFVSNTVIGATASFSADGLHDIRDNYFLGPAAVGLKLRLTDSGGPVERNTIRGMTIGILAEGRSPVSRNYIADCSGDGIHGTPWTSYFYCDSNIIERCGGAGIAAEGSQSYTPPGSVNGNIIRQTAGAGIDLGIDVIWLRGNIVQNTGGDGIRVPGFATDVRDNFVLDAGGDGMVLGGATDFLDNNIVGRSHGAGIRVAGYPHHVMGNTLFSNGGAGIQFSGSDPRDSLENNISALNGGPGLLLEDTGGPYGGPPQLACNDWFQNTGGAVVGTSAGATDLQLNPLFCDLPAADVHLASNSPLLAAAGCGLIGALGEGCVATAAVEEPRPMPITRFRAWPVPATGAISFEMPPSSGVTSIEVFDVTGARRWQGEIAAGATRLEWDRRDSNGRSAAPGVYFARLRRAGAEVATTRIVLAE